ncbi:MAG TPA: sigma-54 dependent transcriptional regulator [Verrucomicrobiae bacterium]
MTPIMMRQPGAQFTCLIIDDDVAFASLAATVVKEAGGQVTLAHNLADAGALTAAKKYELILLDNHLPDGKGYHFYDTLAQRQPELPVMMITGAPDLAEAVGLTRNGLFEYLTKPIAAEALAAAIERAKRRLQAENQPAAAAEWFGQSAAMQEALQHLTVAAKHAASTVLLTGETGVGKDLAARVLHQLSYPKGSAPFIAVNCAALPAEMFESELFGAERGAFTGADRKRAGLAAAAAGGTLFLDEIGEVPLVLQAKLLRLLEAREYRPLGSTEVQPFQGRFVAATNKNLMQEVKAGRFREDLLYRFDVFSIELPPLRQRRVDIPGLAEILLTQLAKKYDRTKPLLTPEDLQKLSHHDFPGNVRELRNVLERSLLKTAETAKWLMLDVNWLNRHQPTAPPPVVPPVSGGVLPAEVPSQPTPGGAVPAERILSPLEAEEYRLIREALQASQGGIRRAAAKLEMSPQALLRRLEKWPELRVDKP